MEGQRLIEAYCKNFQLSREQLLELNQGRQHLINREFERFFPTGIVNEAELYEFYRTSQWNPLGMLHCAVMEINLGYAQWVREQIKELGAKKILDYGCGFSPVAGYMATEGFEVTLSDIPGRHVPILNALYPNARFVALREMDDNEKFDAVICQEVFEHSCQPRETANRVLGFVANGGAAVLSWTFGGIESDFLHLRQNAELEGPFCDYLERLGWKMTANNGGRIGVWQRI